MAKGDFIKPVGTGGNNQLVNKGRVKYMAQPNVQEFNKRIYERVFSTGRPMAFSNLEQTKKDVVEFLGLCQDTNTIPTVMGLATWLGVNRDTIYAHANNHSSPYSDVMKFYIDTCHLSLENSTIDGSTNPVTFIFMAKNYFGMNDTQTIAVKPQENQPNNQETYQAIKEQLENENKDIKVIDYTENN